MPFSFGPLTVPPVIAKNSSASAPLPPIDTSAATSTRASNANISCGCGKSVVVVTRLFSVRSAVRERSPRTTAPCKQWATTNSG